MKALPRYLMTTAILLLGVTLLGNPQPVSAEPEAKVL
jgi:hypothetical protein